MAFVVVDSVSVNYPIMADDRLNIQVQKKAQLVKRKTKWVLRVPICCDS